MHRIEYSRYGGPEELRLADVAALTVGVSQILVKVRAASANPMDWKIRSGAVKMATGRHFPRGVGTDFSGVVEAVGPGVHRLKVGDAVFGAMTMKESSTFSETIVTSEATAALKPAAISFEEAATLPIAGATAWTALIDIGKLQAGQRVFVNGCLGSVGRAAVQIAMMRGATIVGTCSASVIAAARSLGVEEAADYRTLDLARYRKGFDIVFDTAGALSPGQCLSMLTPKGVGLHIDITPFKMIGIMMTRRNKFVFAKSPIAVLEKLGELAADGNLTLPIAGVVPLTKALPAIQELERSGQPKGKLVIVPD